MEEIAYMVCMRVDELDDPVENSTTTACVECGDDIWISAESRKHMGKAGAMPLCSKCAVRIAKENETEVRTLGMPSLGQFQEMMNAAGKRQEFDELPPTVQALIKDMPDDIDPFDALKSTARMAAEVMADAGSDWGSMAVVIDFEGHSMPAIPMQEMLDNGVPKEVIAKQLIPACAQAAQAERVIFGISSWTIDGKKLDEVTSSIGEHPDHEEALVLIDVTADGVQQMSMAEITRDGINKPILGEWVDTKQPDTSSGGLFLDSLIPVLQLIKTLREQS